MDPLISGIVDFDQAKNMAQVQYAVARKIMDNQQMQGNAAIKLITAATNNVSSTGDALVAAATGLGGEVDTYA